MSRKDFYSAEQLVGLITNRKKSVDGRKLSWLNFQHILYNRNEPWDLMIKEYGIDDSSYSLISLLKKNASNNFPRFKLKHLYKTNRAIEKSKYDDLIDLLKYIPDKHHEFYQTLKHN